MGCIPSVEERREREVNEVINRQLRVDKDRESRVIKLLLLGTGESGKSTVLKQIRIIHGGGYSQDDRLATRDVVFSNVVQSMKIIVDAMVSFNMLPQNQENATKHFEFIRNLCYQVETDYLPDEIAKACKSLWADPGVQACFGRACEFQLNDSAKYYLDALDRIAARDYIPTEEDILRSRVKTTGINESCFEVMGREYRIYDVGGQRSERRKWIHCFENVTAILFIVAVSEYDQKLAEDETTNRVREALTLFSSISHNRWFENTSIILFLNKVDLFNQKVANSPIGDHFKEYVRDESKSAAEDGIDFFKAQFKAVFESETGVSDEPQHSKSAAVANRTKKSSQQIDKQSKELYIFETCATDTSQMRNIITSVNDIIIKNNLAECGLV